MVKVELKKDRLPPSAPNLTEGSSTSGYSVPHTVGRTQSIQKRSGSDGLFPTGIYGYWQPGISGTMSGA